MMRSLSALDLVTVWEAGQGQHPLDRALTILAAAYPNATRDALAALPIGERDSRLLRLRGALFGAALNGFAECPHCGERLEFALDVNDLLVPSAPDAAEQAPFNDSSDPVPASNDTPEQAYTLRYGDAEIRFRLPNSYDLAALVNCLDAEEARMLLAHRCVISVGARHAVPLPDDLLAELSRAITECDPQAEILLDLQCPNCGHNWQMLFEIEAFLWAEISTAAKRLLREVHTLARFYGWRENEILSLSPRRRQSYLELVGAGL
jgi:hypothetical protein